MNKELKNALRSAFEPPKPVSKQSFLSSLCFPKTTYKDFLISQVAYIRKRVWVLSVLLPIFAAVFIWQTDFPPIRNINLVWSIAATLPFLALLTASELSRSAFYQMDELEMSCRYSLSQVVLSRAVILGISDIIVFSILLALMRDNVSFNLLQLSLYLAVPYLATCGICLLILNRIHGRESLYYCGAVSCFISLADSLLSTTTKWLYTDSALKGWVLLMIVCIVLAASQMKKLIHRTEEVIWNLY